LADQTKTPKQLSVESDIEALEAQAKQPNSVRPDDASPALPPSTRRRLLSWIAPVVVGLGTALKGGSAQAASTDDFTEPLPVPTGRCIPTPGASASPEGSPSTRVASEGAGSPPASEPASSAAQPTTASTAAPTGQGDPQRDGPTADGELGRSGSTPPAKPSKLT